MKIIATQNVACIINSPHLVPKTPRLTIFKLNSMVRVCQYFGDLMFAVTKNRNTRIPRYGQVCRGTYHAKEIPRYTGVPVFFPNPNVKLMIELDQW